MKRKLKFGMVGGRPGAFIGPVHLRAASFDGNAELVAGAFSSEPGKSKEAGEAYHLKAERVYGSWQEMVEKEQGLPEGERIDFVSIVTPNHLHFDVAKGFLEAGFHVVCDKPMTMTFEQAKALEGIVEKTGKVFVLTHNYTGYPMVKQARRLVSDGELGKINKIVVEYPQGWLSGMLRNADLGLNPWRMDPAKAGGSCAMGDIGIHAENLARYITGLEVEYVCADLSSFVPSNPLEDDANVLIRYKGGAKGILYASQISAGEENGLTIRVYGEKMGLRWNQEFPNYLYLLDPVGKEIRYSRGNDYLCDEAKENSRLPFGHPEGYFEAFANVYNAAIRMIEASVEGKAIPDTDAPGVRDGVIGLAFINTTLESSKSDQKWTKMLE